MKNNRLNTYIQVGYVYLLGDSGRKNIYKIGVTRGSVEKRIKKLQTGNSSEIYLLNKYETDNPFKIESMLHFRHGLDKVKNEWFELNENFKDIFINECEECEKIILSLKNNPFYK